MADAAMLVIAAKLERCMVLALIGRKGP